MLFYIFLRIFSVGLYIYKQIVLEINYQNEISEEKKILIIQVRLGRVVNLKSDQHGDQVQP